MNKQKKKECKHNWQFVSGVITHISYVPDGDAHNESEMVTVAICKKCLEKKFI